MKELNIEQTKFLLQEMEGLQVEHPKANILYDTERGRINITYPLPRDFDKFKDIKIYNDHF